MTKVYRPVCVQSAHEYLRHRLQRCTAFREKRQIYEAQAVMDCTVLCSWESFIYPLLCKYSCFLFCFFFFFERTLQQLPMPMFYTVHAPRTIQQTSSTYKAANFSKFKGWVCIYSKSILIKYSHIVC